MADALALGASGSNPMSVRLRPAAPLVRGAPALGAGARKSVEVQVLSPAPTYAKASVGKLTYAKATVGKLTYAKTSVGELTCAKATVGKPTYAKASVGKPAYAKASVGEPTYITASVGNSAVPSFSKLRTGFKNRQESGKISARTFLARNAFELAEKYSTS